VDGIYSAGSAHGGGATVVKLDGSVAFIADSIDAGDSSHAPPTPEQLRSRFVKSPYGVWGALGTAAGGDNAE
jgi:prepilin-type processing-associated H-X9-DG protein